MSEQRVIKFRAWDVNKKVFLPVETYAILTNDFNALGVMIADWQDYKTGEYLYPNNQTVSQFTGLLDKDGREIYEGDIVERTISFKGSGSTKYIERVVFSDGQFCGQDMYSHTSLTNLFGHQITVIGNIYAHPDLLTDLK